MAAMTAALLCQLSAGDHVVGARAAFGSCRWLLDHLCPRFGIEVSVIDSTDNAAWEASIRANTKVFFFETPANPTLDVVDLQFVCDLARAHGITTVVDNAFATSALQRPLDFGADVVAYSATKLMDGQGRVLAGAVCGSEQWINEVLLPFQRVQVTLARRKSDPASQPVHADEGGEILTLKSAEYVGGVPPLPAQRLYAGFYVNELLLKLLARHDPHAAVQARIDQCRLGQHAAVAALELGVGDAQADLHPFAAETPEVLELDQRPVDPGRRDLERVGEGERVLDVENRAHLTVDLLAIFDADAVLRCCRRPRPIDEHPHHVTGRLTTALDFPDRQATRRRHPFGNRPNMLQRLHVHAVSGSWGEPCQARHAHLTRSAPRHLQTKKVGTSPLGVFLRLGDPQAYHAVGSRRKAAGRPLAPRSPLWRDGPDTAMRDRSPVLWSAAGCRHQGPSHKVVPSASHDLGLDVMGSVDVTLQEDLGSSEVRLRFPRGPLERGCDVLGGPDHVHPSSAAAERGLVFATQSSPSRLRPDFTLRKAWREALAAIADPAAREIAADLYTNSFYRTDVYSKGALPSLTREATRKLRLEQIWASVRGSKDVEYEGQSAAGRISFDNAAARGGDQIGVRQHQGQLAPTNHPLGLGVVRAVDGNVIRLG